jgi:hypothetical protein
VALDATDGDRVFAPDAATFDDAPARRRQCGVDVFGSGFGFVHGCFIPSIKTRSRKPPSWEFCNYLYYN